MALIFERIQTEGIAQLSYLVGDDSAGVAALIDPRADVDCYLELAREKKVSITHIFETHIHADLVSGARELCARVETAKIFVSHEGGASYDFEHEPLHDGDTFKLGSALITVRYTPGHTPEHVSYLVAEKDHPDAPWGVLSGDSLFVSSAGRPDLLGNAQAKKLAVKLFHALRDFYLKLDNGVIVYPGHGAGSPCGADIGDRLSSTIGHERRFNAFLQYEDVKDFTDYALSTAPPTPTYYPRMKKVNAKGPEILGNLPIVRGLPPELFSDKPIGASSYYAQVSGFIGKLFAKRHTESLTYFKDKPPRVSWGFVFVLATIVGGAIAALSGGEFANEWLPHMWEARFGDSIALRAVIGFGGGLLMAFGSHTALENRE